MSTKLALPKLPLFEQAVRHAQQLDQSHPAVVDVRTSKSYSYGDLVSAVAVFRNKILNGRTDLNGERIAFICPSGYQYVVWQWAIWAAGGVAVPLCTAHPEHELLYSVTDSEASLILAHPKYEAVMGNVAKTAKIDLQVFGDSDMDVQEKAIPELFDMEITRPALIIFTSGTTGKPKGVVSSHEAITVQTEGLVQAWRWKPSDRILHVLPLHHIHGIINALQCPLFAGATVEILEKFDNNAVWQRWITGQEGDSINVFMAVPTIYCKTQWDVLIGYCRRHSKLIKHYTTGLSESDQRAATEACAKFRLMVSGSASLPTPVRAKWETISRQVLLERYGTSEFGMGLSQPYEVSERVEGTVGLPLPKVQVRLMAESIEGSGKFDMNVTDEREVPGAIQVKGPNVFMHYYNRPEATAKEFTEDGWYKSGDIGIRHGAKGYFSIMGRSSVDIIKTGGYKVSALEIEREMLSADLGIQDVAVVGVEDEEWGQKVAAVVVLNADKELDLQTMRATLKPKIAFYKVPTLLKTVDELPKNAMGKVTKKALVPLFTSQA
ncbi:long-chain-fatty-acid--CoA ligase [Umbelopsis sp. AD052]|nr:long-chain-fatty-acid--CoA ligase [Umbelopsis sp. AD052]